MVMNDTTYYANRWPSHWRLCNLGAFQRCTMLAALLSLYQVLGLGFQASRFETPGQNRPAAKRLNGPGILPGGRIISPLGKQLLTGPGPFGLGISPQGKIATANLGPERLSLTVWEAGKKGVETVHNFLAAKPPPAGATDDDPKEFRSTFMGLQFSDDKQLWVAEGNSGRVRSLDPLTGERRKLIDLNTDGYTDSFSGDLAMDQARGVLYVTDQANFRICAIDLRKGKLLGSVRVGRLPFAIALAPDGKTAYVTHVGVFEYQAILGVTKVTASERGLTFPAFGFPSADAERGAERERADSGKVTVPGLGDPNVAESNSVAFVNVANPAAMTVNGYVRTGKPFSAEVAGGASPSGVVASGGMVYVSNAHDDTVTVIDGATRQILDQIELRIPGLEALRGVMPLGLAVDAAGGRLLITEAGINAVAIVDLKSRKVLGHIPVGWFPTRVAVAEGTVYVANGKGAGTGPNLPGREGYQDGSGLVDVLRRGTVSVFPSPGDAELPKLTATVMSVNGFLPLTGAAPALSAALKHVVVIVKENRTFDEIFGDVTSASGGTVAGAPPLARFGLNGSVGGGKDRLSLQHVLVTPNHHDLAQRWAMSDNFYSDSEVSVDGHHWLVGNYPDAWTESSLMAAYAGQKDFRLPSTAPGRLSFPQSNSSVHPEEIQQAGTLWHHLERYSISFRNFGEGFELAGVEEAEGEKPTGARYLTNVPMPDALYRNTSRSYPGFNMNIPDQYRASQLIAELKARFEGSGADLPQFVFVHLPGDHIAATRPADGYPYAASFVADNDYALGRIVEYLSHTRWWKDMTIFVTEDDAQGGRDHIDSHRTVLMAAGPYVRKNFVLHQNSSFPGLLKTVFRILGIPPLNLYDATATDLSAMFTAAPDFAPFVARLPDARIFVPENAREPKDPKPSIPMDR
jgi:YVTN family beta-propeller protein